MKVKRINIKIKKYDFRKMRKKEIEQAKQEIQKQKEKYSDEIGARVFIQRYITEDGKHERIIRTDNAIEIAEYKNEDGYDKEEYTSFYNTKKLLKDENGYANEVSKTFDSVEEAENWVKERIKEIKERLIKIATEKLKEKDSETLVFVV